MHRLDRQKAIALLCMLGAIACFGGVPVFLRLLAPHVDMWSVNGVRYAVAAVFWLLLRWRARRVEARAAAGRS